MNINFNWAQIFSYSCSNLKIILITYIVTIVVFQDIIDYISLGKQ